VKDNSDWWKVYEASYGARGATAIAAVRTRVLPGQVYQVDWLSVGKLR